MQGAPYAQNLQRFPLPESALISCSSLMEEDKSRPSKKKDLQVGTQKSFVIRKTGSYEN